MMPDGQYDVMLTLDNSSLSSNSAATSAKRSFSGAARWLPKPTANGTKSTLESFAQLLDAEPALLFSVKWKTYDSHVIVPKLLAESGLPVRSSSVAAGIIAENKENIEDGRFHCYTTVIIGK
jgi:hypothetical protein